MENKQVAANPDGLSDMPRWQQMQYKSFRAWINYNLAGGHPEIDVLTAGLKDGLALAKLLENLSKQTIKGIQKNPKMRIHNISNLAQVFAFVQSVPIKLHSIQPEDIADGNVKLVLGFVWVLILHYQISKPAPKEESPSATPTTAAPKAEDPKALLLARVNNFLVSHNLADQQVKNFVEDWQSGLAFNALLYGEDNSLVDFPSLHGKPPLELLNQAFHLYKEEWGLPAMLEADDFISSTPDEKSVMTYVSLILDAFAGNKRVAKPKAVEPVPEPEPVKQEPPPVVEPPKVEPPPQPKRVITQVQVRIVAARKLRKADKSGSDPFVTLEVHHLAYGKKGGVELKTQVIKESRDPVWNEDFTLHAENVDLHADEDMLVFQLYDWDRVSKNDSLGVVELPLAKLEEGVLFDQWLPIKKKLHSQKDGHGELRVIIGTNGLPLPSLSAEGAQLRVVSAKGLPGKDKGGHSDPYVRIKIKGKKSKDERKTKVVKKTTNPEWNEEFGFASGELINGDVLQFTIFDWDRASKDDALGHAQLPVADAISKGVVDVTLPVLKGKKGKEEGEGSLRVQLAWGSHSLPQLGPKLFVRVAAARDIKSADKSGFSDPYVILNVEGAKDKKKKFKTQVIKQTLKPIWNEDFVYDEGVIHPEKDILSFRLYDHDKASKKDLLGVVFVSVSSIATAGGLYDQWLEIKDPKHTDKKGQGELRVVASLGAPLPQADVSYPVRIRVAAARGLLGADKSGYSDPYAVIEVAGKKIASNKTAVIKKTLDPVWDEEFEFEGGFINVHEDTLEVTVYDKDKVGENTPLGYVAFPFKQLLDNNVFDGWLPLQKPTQRTVQGTGELHLAVAYGAGLPPPAEMFLVAVVAGRNLLASDKGGTSDPYVLIRVPGKKTGCVALKTAVVKKTLDPVWNQDFEFQLRDFDKEEDVLEFHLFDFDNVGDNDPLGVVEVPLKSVVGAPFTDQWYSVKDAKHRDKPGKGELCLRFAFGDEGRHRLDESYGHAGRPALIGGKDTRVKVSEEEQKKVKKQKTKELKKKKKEAQKEKKKKQKETHYDRKPISNFRIRVAAAKSLRIADAGGSSDPYVVVQVPGTHIKHKTKTIKKNVNPVWNEEFNLSKESIDAGQDVLTFSIYDWDMVSSKDLLGIVEIKVKDLLGDHPVDKWFDVMDPQDPEKRGEGELHILAAHGDATLPSIPAKEKKPKKGDKKGEAKKEKKKKGGDKEAKKGKKKGK